MQPLAVDPRILRTLVGPDIKIVPGRAMMARVVVADGTGRGSLSIAGFLTDAELPKGVRAGEDLRLVVRDVSPERVLLSIAPEHAAAQPAPAPPPPASTAVPLPGGGTVQVTERDARGTPEGSAQAHTLALRYDAPALGAVDLQLALDPGTLTVSVTVSAAALAPAQADSEALRTALSDELGRPVSVTIRPRREPVDVYA